MLGRACWVWAGLAWAAAAAGLLKAVATEYSECTLNSSYTFYRVCLPRDSNILSYNFALTCNTVDIYSHVHISSDEVFSKILKKPSILQNSMIPPMNGLLVFIEMKQKNSKWPTRKKNNFPAPPILNVFS